MSGRFMPYTIEWNGQGFIKRMFGFISEHEFMESADAVISHPMFEISKYLINDFSGVSNPKLNALAIAYAEVVETGALQNKHRITVIYVSKDNKVRTVVKQVSGLGSGKVWQTKLFDTIQEAMEWAQTRLSPTLEACNA
jgi:hypothetical protein